MPTENDDPAQGERDGDEWADIVARLEGTAESAPEERRWPAVEDVDPEDPRDGPAAERAEGTQGVPGLVYYTSALSPTPGRGAADRDGAATPAPEDSDRFVPPPPPPAPRLSRAARWGLALVALGAFLVLAPGVVGLHRSTGTLTVAVALILGGAVALLSRTRSGPPQDDGWDDGAVL